MSIIDWYQFDLMDDLSLEQNVNTVALYYASMNVRKYINYTLVCVGQK